MSYGTHERYRTLKGDPPVDPPARVGDAYCSGRIDWIVVKVEVDGRYSLAVPLAAFDWKIPGLRLKASS